MAEPIKPMRNVGTGDTRPAPVWATRTVVSTPTGIITVPAFCPSCAEQEKIIEKLKEELVKGCGECSERKRVKELEAEREAILGKKIFQLDTDKVGEMLLDYAPEQAVGIFKKWKEERDMFQKENADLRKERDEATLALLKEHEQIAEWRKTHEATCEDRARLLQTIADLKAKIAKVEDWANKNFYKEGWRDKNDLRPAQQVLKALKGGETK